MDPIPGKMKKNYIPDFIVRNKDSSMGTIEAKGREDVDVALKDKRAKDWCKEVTKNTDTKTKMKNNC